MKRIKKLFMATVTCLTALCIASCGQPTENKPTDPGNGTNPDEPKEINLHVDYTEDKEVTLKFVEFARGVSFNGKVYVEKVRTYGKQPNPVGEKKISLSEIESLNAKKTDYFNRRYTSIMINGTEYAIIDDRFFQDEDCEQEAASGFDTAYLKVQIITTYKLVEFDKYLQFDKTAKPTGVIHEIKTSYDPDFENTKRNIMIEPNAEHSALQKVGYIINNTAYQVTGESKGTHFDFEIFTDENFTKETEFGKTYSTLYSRVVKVTGEYDSWRDEDYY